MLDGILEPLYLLLLVVPIVFAVGSGLVKWWREATAAPADVSGSNEGPAGIEVLGVSPEGQEYRLRLTNDGPGPARDVHVYVQNTPIPMHRGGASAEPHPVPEVQSGESFSFRYAPGRGQQRDRIVVRVEWDDASGGGVQQTAVRVP